MKRKLIILLMLWMLHPADDGILGMLDFLAVTPNLLLILTVSIGLYAGKDRGLLTGFVCGL